MLKQVFLACILFATINCWVTNNGTIKPFPPNPPAVQCSSVQKVQGCEQCVEEGGKFVCKDASKGYYIDTNQNLTLVCPRQCEACDYNETTRVVYCTDCYLNATDIEGNENCQNCKPGNTLDQQGENGICISFAQNSIYSCAEGFMWNQTPNPNRKCVSQKVKCADNYIFNTYSGQCDLCDKGFTQQVTDIDELYIECLKENVLEYRPAAEQTNEFCKTYDAQNQCIQAKDGYYIDNKIIIACPQQCGTCQFQDDVVSCLTCRDDKGYNDTEPIESNCQCDEFYTADRQIPATSFLCISPVAEKNKIYKCLDGNTWSNQYSQSTERTCVSVSNGTCYQKKGQYLSYWYETPQNERTCTLASLQQCNYNYAQVNADKSNFYDKDLTTNCNSCMDGYQIQSNAGIQTCVKKTSNIISFSLIALFSIFCLLI